MVLPGTPAAAASLGALYNWLKGYAYGNKTVFTSGGSVSVQGKRLISGFSKNTRRTSETL